MNIKKGYWEEGREEVQMSNLLVMMVVRQFKAKVEATVYW